MLHPLTINGFTLVAVDVETTGLTEGFHELIQIGITPIGPDLQPSTTLRPFMSYLRPQFPQRANAEALAVNGLNLDWLLATAPEPGVVATRLDDYIYSLSKRGVVPLAHNWAFESGFLKAWLGIDHLQTAFARRARDTMIYAGHLMDRAEVAGLAPPFPGLSLNELTSFFGIRNENAHDALADATATIHLYRKLLEWDLNERPRLWRPNESEYQFTYFVAA